MVLAKNLGVTTKLSQCTQRKFAKASVLGEIPLCKSILTDCGVIASTSFISAKPGIKLYVSVDLALCLISER